MLAAIDSSPNGMGFKANANPDEPVGFTSNTREKGPE